MSRHHKTLSTRRWLIVRREALDAVNMRCQGKGCKRLADDVHHVTPLYAGGDPYAFSNLLCLCAECHHKVHAGPLTMERRGFRKLARSLVFTPKDNC